MIYNLQLSNFKVHVPQESINLVTKTLKSGWIGGDGPRVKEFEKEIGKMISNENTIAVNSGTSALQLALRLAGAAGGEVVSTPMTCFATNAAIVKSKGFSPTGISSATSAIDIQVDIGTASRTLSITNLHLSEYPVGNNRVTLL